jgi:quercetin dioxygenase-like cupin family protein
MRLRILFVFAVVCLLAVGVCFAQDPVKVDPKHYKVESENADVRILRIHYGPHEKSVMHSHPDSVVVYLDDGTIRMHTPDGKSQDTTGKAGQAQATPAGTHMPENTGDKEFNAVLVELKHPKSSAAAKK